MFNILISKLSIELYFTELVDKSLFIIFSLRCTHDGTLKEMLVFYRPRHPKKMFYQRLTLPIHELENKRQLKCTFMSIDQKEEKEVTLYPNKGSKVEQMLDEAKQVVCRF